MDQHDGCARPETRPQTRPLRGTCITRTVDIANPRLIGVWKWNFEEANRRLYAVCVFAPNVLRDDYPLEDLQHLKDCIAQPGSPLNFATRCFVEMCQLSLSKEVSAGCVAAGALAQAVIDNQCPVRRKFPSDLMNEARPEKFPLINPDRMSLMGAPAFGLRHLLFLPPTFGIRRRDQQVRSAACVGCR